MVAELSAVRRLAIELAAPLVCDQLVILTGSAARSQPMARFFSDAGGRTVSHEIAPERAETRAKFAAYEELLACPSDQTRQWFDVVDPDRNALVYAGSFTAVQQVCGRTTIGARTPGQMIAERKDIQHEFLQLSGRLVEIRTGLSSFDCPMVVQGIPDQGIAMATSHTYLIPRRAPEDQLVRLAEELHRDCTVALVSEFDFGTPCTFYGFVTTEAVYDFGPVEALVYWNRRTWRLHASGIIRPLAMTNTTAVAARNGVRNAVGRLHQRTAYLGAFGIDGVLKGHDYMIHEINPRICAGFSLLNELAPTISPLAALDLVLRERRSTAAIALASSLTELANAFYNDGTSAYRLWENGSHSLSERYDHATWARQIRRQVSQPELIPVAELEELES